MAATAKDYLLREFPYMGVSAGSGQQTGEPARYVNFNAPVPACAQTPVPGRIQLGFWPRFACFLLPMCHSPRPSKSPGTAPDARCPVS
jgi:hypothetical protein